MKVFHRGFHFFFSPPLLLLLFSSHLPAAHASCTTTNSGNTDCQPIPDATIHTAVNAWVDNPVTAEASYGHIRDWDISQVTSTSGLFCGTDWACNCGTRCSLFQEFNEDLSGWNVSSVTDMSYMFFRVYEFNQDLSGWDVSSVTSMQRMFYSAQEFNQDLSQWDVSSVTDMSYMFYNARVFNQDLSQWEVSSVTSMERLFSAAQHFNSDISQWDVSSVTDMSYMFNKAQEFNQDLSQWEVSSVTTMYQMFYDAQEFNQDLSEWNVSSVTTMSLMLCNAQAFNQDLSQWEVSSVTSFEYMFFETCMMRVDHLPLGMSAEGTNLDVCLTCTNCPEEGGECLHNFKRADSLMCDVCPGSETEILGNCQTCPSTFGEFLTFPPVTIALVLLLVVSMVLTISSYKPEGAEGIGVMRAGAEVGSNTGTTGAGVTTRVVVEGSSSVEGRAGRLGRAEKENVSVENNKEEKEDKEDSKREDEDKETMHPGGGGQRPQRRKKRWCSFWWWWWQCTNKGWTFLSNFKWDVTNTIRAKQLGASVQILQVFARLSPNMADWFLVVANRFSQLSLPVVEVQPVCSSWYEALSRSEWAFLKAWFLFLLLHAVIMGLCRAHTLPRLSKRRSLQTFASMQKAAAFFLLQAPMILLPFSFSVERIYIFVTTTGRDFNFGKEPTFTDLLQAVGSIGFPLLLQISSPLAMAVLLRHSVKRASSEYDRLRTSLLKEVEKINSVDETEEITVKDLDNCLPYYAFFCLPYTVRESHHEEKVVKKKIFFVFASWIVQVGTLLRIGLQFWLKYQAQPSSSASTAVGSTIFILINFRYAYHLLHRPYISFRPSKTLGDPMNEADLLTTRVLSWAAVLLTLKEFLVERQVMQKKEILMELFCAGVLASLILSQRPLFHGVTKDLRKSLPRYTSRHFSRERDASLTDFDSQDTFRPRGHSGAHELGYGRQIELLLQTDSVRVAVWHQSRIRIHGMPPSERKRWLPRTLASPADSLIESPGSRGVAESSPFSTRKMSSHSLSHSEDFSEDLEESREEYIVSTTSVTPASFMVPTITTTDTATATSTITTSTIPNTTKGTRRKLWERILHLGKRSLWYLLAFPVAILSLVAVALGTAFALVHAAESDVVLGIVASLPLVLCLGMEGMVARSQSRQKQRRLQEDDSIDYNNNSSTLHLDNDLVNTRKNKPGKGREEKEGVHFPRPFSDVEGGKDDEKGTAAVITTLKPRTTNTTVTSPIFDAATPTSGSPHPHNGNLQVEMREIAKHATFSSFPPPLKREATEKGKGHDNNKLGPSTTKKQLKKTHSMQTGPSVSTLLTKFETNTKTAQL